MDPICNEHNINPLTQRLEGGRWEDMCLVTQNMKPNISSNESQNILNNVMNTNVFPPMDTPQKVYPC